MYQTQTDLHLQIQKKSVEIGLKIKNVQGVSILNKSHCMSQGIEA